MKSSYCLLVLAFLLPVYIVAEDPPSSEVVFIKKEEVDKAFARGPPFVSNSRYRVSAKQRSEPGIAGIHGFHADIFLVVEGAATMVTGGKIVREEESAPGEFRGTEIEGGTENRLSKGDVIVVPKGTPHWFSSVDDEFR